MPVRDDICGECGLPFEGDEKRWGVSGRMGFSHESAAFCVRRLKKLIGHDVVVLTHDEALSVAGIVGNHISEMGSIYNDYEKIDEENKLRAKLGLVPVDPTILKPPCRCHPMVSGTNPNCPRHGLAPNPVSELRCCFCGRGADRAFERCPQSGSGVHAY